MVKKALFLENGGEMGELTRNFDWSSTALGNIDTWSQSLLTCVNMMLRSRFPMLIFWGTDLVTFYNDAFRPSLGNDGKHPGSLGQPGHISWAESWPVIGPMIHGIMKGEEAVWFEDQKLPIYREGKMGYAYWTYSFSPLLDDNASIGGLLVTCSETTKSVESVDKLAESEKRFRTMAESSDVLIAMSDESSKAIYFNRAWEKLLGRSQVELNDFGWADLIHTEDKEQYVNKYLSAFAMHDSFTGEFRVKNVEGNYRWLMAQGAPRFHTDGSFAGYISSCFDITEQKQDEQRKNDFIAMVSHELKTPLTSIKGFIELLGMKAFIDSPAFVEDVVGRVTRQADKMTTMINGFLNVSRLESGKLSIIKTRFDMAELLNETKEDAITLYPGRNLVFHPVEHIQVEADWDKIGNVISNFISNAIKYAPGVQPIQVACVADADDVVVSVRDEGSGIKKENIPRLFDRYYRVHDNPGQLGIGGFGIGLYLCEEIIQRHEGRIWVESEWGKGSVFYFSLPLAK